MRAKRKWIVACALALAVSAGLWLLLGRTPNARSGRNREIAGGDAKAPSGTPNAAKPGANSKTAAFPSLAERSQMSDSDRLRCLERLGQLPDPRDLKDLQLAQKTSWWGKPLDPKKFWRNRVVWCDRGAMAAAAAHGRVWPPPPYEDPKLPRYPDDDGIQGRGYGAEGTGVSTASSSKERAFWLQFLRTHPRPPEEIESHQRDIAEQVFQLPGVMQKTAEELEKRGRGNQLSPDAAGQIVEALKRDELQGGFPPEALSDQALFWAYVLSYRQRYQQLLDAGPPAAVAQAQTLFEGLAVDKKLVAEPLNDAQLRAANAWKTSYLRRLRRQKSDESYINAYLQAWNLSASQVFDQADGL